MISEQNLVDEMLSKPTKSSLHCTSEEAFSDGCWAHDIFSNGRKETSQTFPPSGNETGSIGRGYGPLRACEACRKRKTKCDIPPLGVGKCKKCTKSGRVCIFPFEADEVFLFSDLLDDVDTEELVDLFSDGSDKEGLSRIPNTAASGSNEPTSSTSSLFSSPRAGEGNSPPPAPFIAKLYDMMNGSNSKFCGFVEGKNQIYISTGPSFETEVLPRYFQHSNIMSFRRQLQNYDFRKQRSFHSPMMVFDHDYFCRDCPELLYLIQRKNVKNTKSDYVQDHPDQATISVNREHASIVLAQEDSKHDSTTEQGTDGDSSTSSLTDEVDDQMLPSILNSEHLVQRLRLAEAENDSLRRKLHDLEHNASPVTKKRAAVSPPLEKSLLVRKRNTSETSTGDIVCQSREEFEVVESTVASSETFREICSDPNLFLGGSSTNKGIVPPGSTASPLVGAPNPSFRAVVQSSEDVAHSAIDIPDNVNEGVYASRSDQLMKGARVTHIPGKRSVSAPESVTEVIPIELHGGSSTGLVGSFDIMDEMPGGVQTSKTCGTCCYRWICNCCFTAKALKAWGMAVCLFLAVILVVDLALNKAGYGFEDDDTDDHL